MDLLSLFLLWTYLKHLIQWIVMLFWILLMDRQLPRNFIALLQNWLDICYACVSWGGWLSYRYLVQCYSWCELGRSVIASFLCNLIYLYGCFNSKIKIIWLWLLSVWCIFWLPNVCWCIVSSYCVGCETYVEDMWFICPYAVDYDIKFNSIKLCGRPTICPAPANWPLTF